MRGRAQKRAWRLSLVLGVQEVTLRIKSLTAGIVALVTAGTLQLTGVAPAIAGDTPGPPPAAGDSGHGGPALPDQHNVPTNAVSGNVTFLDNVHGVSGYSSLN